ncbi:MAG: hypothetical protein QNK18_02715 [Gammaproteobacteria bacterium]|nr:hypothetical protein [Gammaproteobacteria bacterium]
MKRVLAAVAVVFVAFAFADQTIMPHHEQARKDFFWNPVNPSDCRTLNCDQEFRGHEPSNIEHVYAANWMAQHQRCRNRSACRQHSTDGMRFTHIEADLPTLYPAMGRIDSGRSDHRFGIIDEEEGPSPVACYFGEDKSARSTEGAARHTNPNSVATPDDIT